MQSGIPNGNEPPGPVLVAAKRFAASMSGVGNDVKVPLSALRSAIREVEALCAVRGHPNIVTLLGVVAPSLQSSDGVDLPKGEIDAATAAHISPPLQLLLSLCAGSLFNLIRNASAWDVMPRAARIALLSDAACGLTALHEANFAHLDIKSHNILVDRKESGVWVAQLCDLGSACCVTSGLPPPPEGTSGWTAPEILDPSSVQPRADPRLADVFSFGVVIWEAVSGPVADHPLCGLAGDDYCVEVACGVRPIFPDAASPEAMLAERCWKFEAKDRPAITEVAACLISMLDQDGGIR